MFSAIVFPLLSRPLGLDRQCPLCWDSGAGTGTPRAELRNRRLVCPVDPDRKVSQATADKEVAWLCGTRNKKVLEQHLLENAITGMWIKKACSGELLSLYKCLG